MVEALLGMPGIDAHHRIHSGEILTADIFESPGREAADGLIAFTVSRSADGMRVRAFLHKTAEGISKTPVADTVLARFSESSVESLISSVRAGVETFAGAGSRDVEMRASPGRKSIGVAVPQPLTLRGDRTKYGRLVQAMLTMALSQIANVRIVDPEDADRLFREAYLQPSEEDRSHAPPIADIIIAVSHQMTVDREGMGVFYVELIDQTRANTIGMFHVESAGLAPAVQNMAARIASMLGRTEIPEYDLPEIDPEKPEQITEGMFHYLRAIRSLDTVGVDDLYTAGALMPDFDPSGWELARRLAASREPEDGVRAGEWIVRLCKRVSPYDYAPVTIKEVLDILASNHPEVYLDILRDVLESLAGVPGVQSRHVLEKALRVSERKALELCFDLLSSAAGAYPRTDFAGGSPLRWTVVKFLSGRRLSKEGKSFREESMFKLSKDPDWKKREIAVWYISRMLSDKHNRRAATVTSVIKDALRDDHIFVRVRAQEAFLQVDRSLKLYESWFDGVTAQPALPFTVDEALTLSTDLGTWRIKKVYKWARHVNYYALEEYPVLLPGGDVLVYHPKTHAASMFDGPERRRPLKAEDKTRLDGYEVKGIGILRLDPERGKAWIDYGDDRAHWPEAHFDRTTLKDGGAEYVRHGGMLLRRNAGGKIGWALGFLPGGAIGYVFETFHFPDGSFWIGGSSDVGVLVDRYGKVRGAAPGHLLGSDSIRRVMFHMADRLIVYEKVEPQKEREESAEEPYALFQKSAPADIVRWAARQDDFNDVNAALNYLTDTGDVNHAIDIWNILRTRVPVHAGLPMNQLIFELSHDSLRLDPQVVIDGIAAFGGAHPYSAGSDWDDAIDDLYAYYRRHPDIAENHLTAFERGYRGFGGAEYVTAMLVAHSAAGKVDECVRLLSAAPAGSLLIPESLVYKLMDAAPRSPAQSEALFVALLTLIDQWRNYQIPQNWMASSDLHAALLKLWEDLPDDARERLFDHMMSSIVSALRTGHPRVQTVRLMNLCLDTGQVRPSDERRILSLARIESPEEAAVYMTGKEARSYRTVFVHFQEEVGMALLKMGKEAEAKDILSRSGQFWPLVRHYISSKRYRDGIEFIENEIKKRGSLLRRMQTALEREDDSEDAEDRVLRHPENWSLGNALCHRALLLEYLGEYDRALDEMARVKKCHEADMLKAPQPYYEHLEHVLSMPDAQTRLLVIRHYLAEQDGRRADALRILDRLIDSKLPDTHVATYLDLAIETACAIGDTPLALGYTARFHKQFPAGMETVQYAPGLKRKRYVRH